MISIFAKGRDPFLQARALLLLLLVLGASGCGSSPTDMQGSAKSKNEEDRYRVESTAKGKQKVLIRNKEERFKDLGEPSKQAD